MAVILFDKKTGLVISEPGEIMIQSSEELRKLEKDFIVITEKETEV